MCKPCLTWADQFRYKAWLKLNPAINYSKITLLDK
jgi:hypothetical protein